MKTFFYSLLLSAALASPVAAQNLAGKWQGKLEAAPGTTLTIQFVITAKPGGGYSAVVTSPDEGAIKNVPATSVNFADSKLTLEVPALSGGYAGTLRNGVFEGEWSQEGAKLPLSMRPYETPTLTKADIDTLRGEWSGKLTAGGNTVTIVLRFTAGADGALRASFDVPEQGVSEWEAKDVVLDDGNFSVVLPRPQAGVKGTLKGDQIVGVWTQSGMTFPLTLKKDTAANAEALTPEAAAPYLGLYWAEPLQRPMIVVLYKDRLALELPWRSLRELKKTTEKDVWSYVVNPENLVKFHRTGAGRATAMELRQDEIATLPRFEPEKGLPSVDELFARRPDAQRAKLLSALGTIRMSGGITRTTTPGKGSFEVLSSGDEHSRTKLNLDGGEAQVIVAGKRVWMQPQPSSPAQEMPEAMARATRLGGWTLATGDWRDEFQQVRVLKRVELDGKPVFLVHAAPEKGRQRLVYLDTESGLALGFDEVYEIPGVGTVGSEIRFADYRDVEGVQIPFKTTVKYSKSELGTWTYQVEKIEAHLKLDKDPFTIN